MTAVRSGHAVLHRDPLFDGATDPFVVIDAAGTWWMFTTQRRATHPAPGPGVAWVHGSRIAVATSPDGLAWSHRGTLAPGTEGSLDLSEEPPPDPPDRTHWAPAVVHDGIRWRMYLTEIDGVPDRWPGHARHIVEYASDDLFRWRRLGPLSLASDRVIDAAVARCPDGRWRLWYKDEAADSVTKVAVCEGMSAEEPSVWTDEGVAIGGRPHEGPDVIAQGGFWWMIVDEWRGMGVYRSDDAVHWQRQGGSDAVVLDDLPGTGHHGASVRHGDEVWFYYFTHPGGGRPSAIHRARRMVADGILHLV